MRKAAQISKISPSVAYVLNIMIKQEYSYQKDNMIYFMKLHCAILNNLIEINQ